MLIPRHSYFFLKHVLKIYLKTQILIFDTQERQAARIPIIDN